MLDPVTARQTKRPWNKPRSWNREEHSTTKEFSLLVLKEASDSVSSRCIEVKNIIYFLFAVG